jgi:RNA polymerase sigma-70 factor (ECF subfamily)
MEDIMDEKDIINLFWNRNDTAIVELDKSYGALCFTVISAILTNPDDVEECVNDVYFKIWSSIPPNWPKNLKAFICKIARHLALDKYKFQHRKKRYGNEIYLSCLELDGITLVDEKAKIEEYSGETELIEAINCYLDTISKRDRVIFLRRYWYFDSIKEISRKMDMKENTVKTILFRSRDGLLNRLKKEGLLR